MRHSLRPFHAIRVLAVTLPFLLSMACGKNDDTLCKRYYVPYPDLVGQRQRTAQNAAFLDAMAFYDRGEYAAAAQGLKTYVDKNEKDVTARMYLASALLGAGEPSKAEMHLDFLERSPNIGFKDQVEWYNALCWLCSGQYTRCLQQCMWITQRPAHTYKQQAQELVDMLTDH